MPKAAVKMKKIAKNVVKFMTDFVIPGSVGLDPGTYFNVSGYHTLNITVKFSQKTAAEPPVDVQVMFAWDPAGKMCAGKFINVGLNVPSGQKADSLYVSGADTWHGNPHDVSTFIVRVPVLAPYAKVIAHNAASFDRTVSVWGYLEK